MHTGLATLLFVAATAAGAQPTLYTTRLRLADFNYQSPDRVTTVHERTHQLNAALAQQHGGAAFYTGEGRFYWVRPMKAPTLGAIASRIRFRGRLFQTYLVQARQPAQPQLIRAGLYLEGHDRNPLSLFDELSAYANGADIAVRYPGNQWSDRVTSALEMAHYAATCYHYAPLTYQDRRTLRGIWLAQAQRLDRIARRARATGQQYEQLQGPWHAELLREMARLRAAGE
jgi:hypothetical protein